MHYSKYSPKLKIEIAKAYLNDEGSLTSLAKQYQVGVTSIKEWVWRFREHGEAAFQIAPSFNAAYSSELKYECVQAVLSGNLTVNEVIAKYNISSRSVLRAWIKEYNANGTLKDYIPKREVYMAGSGRKTTLEERIAIVKYCIEHDKNYKSTASIYDVSYSQVYYWVKKYEASSEEGLMDKRGRHKTDDAVDEFEKLKRENARLKRQIEEKNMAIDLLKKVKEFERR